MKQGGESLGTGGSAAEERKRLKCELPQERSDYSANWRETILDIIPAFMWTDDRRRGLSSRP